MSLSKRLLQIASFVDQDALIADVGSDHAELPIFLLQEKRIRWAQTIENKQGPYQIMEAAIEQSGFLSQCELSLSDGLNELSPRVDTVVLAGMGGNLVLSIIEKQKSKLKNVKTLIIDAHTDRSKVRANLPSLGFRIIDEAFLIDEGIAYEIIKAVADENAQPYTALEIAYGPVNLKKRPLAWLEELRTRKKRLEALLQKNVSEKQKERWKKEIQELAMLLKEKA